MSQTSSVSEIKPTPVAQRLQLLGSIGLAGISGAVIRDAFQTLSKADPKNVQQIAASQLELLAAYHQVALAQSRRSFFWGLIGSGVGLLLFVVAVAFSLLKGIEAASVPLLSGAIVQAVSGLVFYLYGKTSSQLSAFHSRLEVLQRYLLANSICEGLDGDERNKARAGLVQEISRGRTDLPATPATPSTSAASFPS